MIILMLKNTRLPSLEFLLDFPSFRRQGFDLDPFGANHLSLHVGETQTSFDFFVFSVGIFYDTRVDQHSFFQPSFGISARVVNHESFVDTNLRSRQSDTFGSIHNLEHFLGKFCDALLFVGERYFRVLGTQRRVGIFDYSQICPIYNSGINLFFGGGSAKQRRKKPDVFVVVAIVQSLGRRGNEAITATAKSSSRPSAVRTVHKSRNSG
mmetsp:Transcript_22859/g.53985  ORF Transcript_22859/g.53985 Transcript_22859/m.53985 type:complete len:209 (-) Transcript_22859:319-945(-)